MATIFGWAWKAEKMVKPACDAVAVKPTAAEAMAMAAKRLGEDVHGRTPFLPGPALEAVRVVQ